MPAFLVEYPAHPGLTLPEGADKFVVFASDAANARAMVAGHFGGDANALIQSSDMAVTEVVVGAAAEDTGYDMSIRIVGAADPLGNVFVEAKSAESLAIGAVALNSGGIATYVIDDILTAVGGTFQRAATFRVITVSTGVITAIELVDPGDYSVLPSLTANAVTGGGGTTATMDLTAALAGSHAQVAGKLVTKINASANFAGATVDLSEGAAGTRLFTVSSIGDGFGDATLTFEVSKNGVALPQLVSTIVDAGIAGAVLTAAIPASPLAPAQVTAVKG